MRTYLLVCLIGLILAFGMTLIGASLTDPLASFDPYRPATLLSVAARQLQALRAHIGELRLTELGEAFFAPHRKEHRQDPPTQPQAR
jgi:hypothetical protein